MKTPLLVPPWDRVTLLLLPDCVTSAELPVPDCTTEPAVVTAAPVNTSAPPDWVTLSAFSVPL